MQPFLQLLGQIKKASAFAGLPSNSDALTHLHPLGLSQEAVLMEVSHGVKRIN
jgi:hypothetical protein